MTFAGKDRITWRDPLSNRAKVTLYPDADAGDTVVKLIHDAEHPSRVLNHLSRFEFELGGIIVITKYGIVEDEQWKAIIDDDKKYSTEYSQTR